MPNAKISTERRSNKRFSIKIPVKYRLAGQGEMLSVDEWRKSEKNAITLDLSLGGMQIVVEESLKMGSLFKFNIYLLADELMLLVDPVQMGKGERIFAAGAPPPKRAPEKEEKVEGWEILPARFKAGAAGLTDHQLSWNENLTGQPFIRLLHLIYQYVRGLGADSAKVLLDRG